MGLKWAPDFAQQVMEDFLCDVDDMGIYIGGFSTLCAHDILLLDKIFHQYEANGLTVNPLKC